MDKINKALKKLSAKERKVIEIILQKIENGSFKELNIKALKGYNNIYRVRKGHVRIIFGRDGDKIIILAVERRSEKTYQF